MEPFSFGAPKRRRLSMQFGYEMQPSFWQGVRSHSHLVIAAIGTAALLGVAAVALWLALPASERQAKASPEQIVPAIPVKTTKMVAATAAEPVVAPKPEISQDGAKADVQALASNDPRWTKPEQQAAAGAASSSDQKTSQAASKPAAAEAFAEPAAATDAVDKLSRAAAANSTTTTNKTDGAQTAAIAAVEPQVPEAQPTAADSEGPEAKAKPRKTAAAGNGRILRAVTMRSGPKKRAAAISTLPAKTSVQVIGCKDWCQIVYNGKRGWVYKSYVKSGG